MIDTEFLDPGYVGLRPRSYDALTGLPFRPWTQLKDIEVVEDVLNDMRSNDRERDLALRLLDLLEGKPVRYTRGPRRHST